MDSSKNRKKESNKSRSTQFKTSTKREIKFKVKPETTNAAAKKFSTPRQKKNTPSSGREESGGTHSLKSARKQYHDVKKKNLALKEKAAKKREEIKIALQKYDQRKQQKNRKLMAKTSKGQPLMKNRIEILLEKIRSSVQK